MQGRSYVIGRPVFRELILFSRVYRMRSSHRDAEFKLHSTKLVLEIPVRYQGGTWQFLAHSLSLFLDFFQYALTTICTVLVSTWSAILWVCRTA